MLSKRRVVLGLSALAIAPVAPAMAHKDFKFNSKYEPQRAAYSGYPTGTIIVGPSKGLEGCHTAVLGKEQLNQLKLFTQSDGALSWHEQSIVGPEKQELRWQRNIYTDTAFGPACHPICNLVAGA